MSAGSWLEVHHELHCNRILGLVPSRALLSLLKIKRSGKCFDIKWTVAASEYSQAVAAKDFFFGHYIP